MKVISNMAVEFDNIDIQEATRRGIVVGNTSGVLTDTTADFAFGLLMAAARRIVEADKSVRSGKWPPWGPMVFVGHDIHRATLGKIGLGRIGTAVARRAAGFAMRVIYFDLVRNRQAENELAVVTSMGTDGVDGPTDAAGAIVDWRTVLRAEANGIDTRQLLSENDSYRFSKLGDLIITGPTGTNVNDIAVIVALNAER